MTNYNINCMCDCDNNIQYSMTQGDNTENFNNHFLEIYIENIHQLPITKAIFQAGQLQKVYENPVFPLFVDFTEEDTKLLKFKNVGYLMVYDIKDRPVTCDGSIEFYCRKGVVYV